MATVRPVAERFREKYRIDPNSKCWLWVGATDKNGYGQFQVDGKTRPAHVYAWLFAGRPESADGKVLDHLCRNRNCVNPEHLERVTVGENVRRGFEAASNVQAGACPVGHLLTLENSYIRSNSFGRIRFYCKTCAKRRANERNARIRQNRT